MEYAANSNKPSFVLSSLYLCCGLLDLKLLYKGRTFILDHSYPGRSGQVKQQIIDTAMNGSEIRDTARVLHVSPSTVIKELEKKRLTFNK